MPRADASGYRTKVRSRPVKRAQRAPAIMFLPGYQMDPPIPKEWARKGYIRLATARQNGLIGPVSVVAHD